MTLPRWLPPLALAAVAFGIGWCARPAPIDDGALEAARDSVAVRDSIIREWEADYTRRESERREAHRQDSIRDARREQENARLTALLARQDSVLSRLRSQLAAAATPGDSLRVALDGWRVAEQALATAREQTANAEQRRTLALNDVARLAADTTDRARTIVGLRAAITGRDVLISEQDEAIRALRNRPGFKSGVLAGAVLVATLVVIVR